ncbi:hypothetical protein C8Q77DRAFT_307225 [Trametes polyzona]|nr:hypothetical protein C8Q77DRAFT_307225 [Trametes polyzona]
MIRLCSNAEMVAGGREQPALHLAFLIWMSRQRPRRGHTYATAPVRFRSHASLTFTTMSTRSAARSRQASRTTEPSVQDSATAAAHDEEYQKTNGSSGRTRVTRKSSKTYCVCKKPDDGSPMIHCSSCKDWFHFRCVELSEQDAEEIQLYICPSCHQKTGARIIRMGGPRGDPRVPWCKGFPRKTKPKQQGPRERQTRHREGTRTGVRRVK